MTGAARRRLARAAAGLFFLIPPACDPGGDPQADPPRERLDESAASPAATHLLLLHAPRGAARSRVVELDLKTRERRVVLELPSVDVAAAPGGRWLSYVSGGGANEDFVERPELHVVDIEADVDRSLGAGVTPLWDATGTKLAWLRPHEARGCAGELCGGETEVWSALATGDPQQILPAGHWTVLAWSGDDVLVADATRGGEVLAVAPDGAVDRLTLLAPELWDASPDGDLLVTVQGRKVTLESRAGRAVAEVDVDGRLADGEWAPDGTRLAAVVLGGSDRAVLLDADGTPPRPLRPAGGAVGGVTWSSTGGQVALVRERAGRLQAMVCETRTAACAPAFSWREGFVVLALAQRGRTS